MRQGVFAPHIREIYTQNLRMFTSFFSQFFRKSTDALVGPIFTLNTSYDVVLHEVVPFGGEKI